LPFLLHIWSDLKMSFTYLLEVQFP
jgi:hypothetical protein